MEKNNTEQYYKEESIPSNKKYIVPVAIIIAGILMAGALYFNSKSQEIKVDSTSDSEVSVGVPAISENDHILGNPNAKILIVEYSDLECPFCKKFHDTMHQIINEYGANSDVAWVYRHFPITNLHSKAVKEAEASECAAELGGNQGFWNYVDRLYEITPSNNNLDLNQLSVIAEDVGIDPMALQACVDSGKYADKIQAQFDEAIASGARGTPYNVIFVNGEQAPIEGAQPIEVMRKVIETLLNDSN